MIDPLRSLAELVRTLTRPRAESRGNTSETQRRRVSGDDPAHNDPAPAAGGVDALRERLRQRLRAVGTTDRRRAREAFVETVVASELGESLTLDPSMAHIVSKVAQQLGNDPATERDLSALMDELVR
jgi:hypothetical protein